MMQRRQTDAIRAEILELRGCNRFFKTVNVQLQIVALLLYNIFQLRIYVSVLCVAIPTRIGIR
jgi:hypothetical protein